MSDPQPCPADHPESQPCPTCSGSGRGWSDVSRPGAVPCVTCRGSGRVLPAPEAVPPRRIGRPGDMAARAARAWHARWRVLS